MQSKSMIVLGYILIAIGAIVGCFGGVLVNKGGKFNEFYIDIGDLKESGGPIFVDGKGYQRSVDIRNNTNFDKSNVKIIIKNAPQEHSMPWLEGAGDIMVKYQKVTGDIYETEIGSIPANKFVKIIFYSENTFSIDKKDVIIN